MIIIFYQLQSIEDIAFEIDKDDDRIGIDNEIIKLCKISGSYKDYSSNFYKVLSKAFITYILIMNLLFETIAICIQADPI